MVGAAVACEWESKCNGEPVGATTLEERERETEQSSESGTGVSRRRKPEPRDSLNWVDHLQDALKAPGYSLALVDFLTDGPSYESFYKRLRLSEQQYMKGGENIYCCQRHR